MPTDPADARLAEVLRRHLPYLPADAELEPEVPLKNYGLDSMQAVELVFAIEDDLGVMIPDEAMVAKTFETFTSLSDAVEAARGEQVNAG